MRAENQTMHIEETQGQQTVQCLFLNVGPKKALTISNIAFSPGTAESKGYPYYVFSGTMEHYEQFRAVMSQYGVLPAHESGVDLDDVRPGSEPPLDEPVVVTDPGKPEKDTLSAPAELEPEQQGGTNSGDQVQRGDGAEPAPEAGQPAPGQDHQSGAGAGGDALHGGGSTQAPGGAAGGTAQAGDVPGTVRQEVKPAATDDDPFADL